MLRPHYTPSARWIRWSLRCFFGSGGRGSVELHAFTHYRIRGVRRSAIELVCVRARVLTFICEHNQFDQTSFQCVSVCI